MADVVVETPLSPCHAESMLGTRNDRVNGQGVPSMPGQMPTEVLAWRAPLPQRKAAEVPRPLGHQSWVPFGGVEPSARRPSAAATRSWRAKPWPSSNRCRATRWMSKVVMTMGLSESEVDEGALEGLDQQRRANQEDTPVTDHGRSDVAIEWTLVFHERAGGLLVVLSPELLKVACAARGWSLTHLAVRAEISRPTLRTVLKGRPVRPRTMWNEPSSAPLADYRPGHLAHQPHYGLGGLGEPGGLTVPPVVFVVAANSDHNAPFGPITAVRQSS
jgi:hypothetical protein